MKIGRKMVGILIMTGMSAFVLMGCGNTGNNEYSDYSNNYTNENYSNSGNSSSQNDSNTESGEGTDSGSTDDSDMDYVPVTDYDGWWYVDDSSYEGTTLFTTLMVDAASLEWMAYDSGGFDIAGGEISITVGTTNALVLDFGDSGIVELTLTDGRLVTQDGVSYYQMAETDNSTADNSQYTGTWYDPSYEKSISLMDDNTYAFYTSESSEPYQQGAYESVVYTHTDSADAEYSTREFNFDFGEGMINATSMTLIDDVALLDKWSGATYYVREDMIGQTQGNIAALHCTLLLHNWYSEEYGDHLAFEESGRVVFSVDSADGPMELMSGNFTLDESTITITWSEGAMDYLSINEDGTILLQSTQETFIMQ